ncbi:Ferric uptake regulation protein FUR [hydrothermal vent metagenome]|uniref:Ferric uptake regulation protein FUR n=1 Tax=hydrothermal vent metagenome TaxID=652676 RepID=A0A1W1BSL3_9ZZZZ
MVSYTALLETFKQLLKGSSLKFTKQRELVLKTLYENDGHFTPEDLYNLIKSNHPEVNIGIATVYRTLTLLEESGIANSISFGSKGKKYEMGLKEHHDHLICIECGKLIEFQDETIEKRQEEIAQKFNFKMTDHIMNITGICEACQTTSR